MPCHASLRPFAPLAAVPGFVDRDNRAASVGASAQGRLRDAGSAASDAGTGSSADRVAGRRAQRVAGFSLIELLVTGVVLAVLASLAYPALGAQIAKTRRSDARVAIAAAQLAQERWRAQQARYGTALEIGLAPTSELAHYRLEVASPGPRGYTLLATALGAQARDAECRHLRLTVEGATLRHASGPDASVVNAAAANRRCWGG